MSAILLVAWCIGLAMSPATGQGIFRSMRGVASGRFIEPPRQIEQQLREAERALSEGRTSDAVVRLGDLLATERTLDDSDLSGQDFFMDARDAGSADQPRTQSLLRTARRMIGELPNEALETYELRYGPLARRMLQQAAQARDWAKVREVRRMYFHTLAGYEASMLLAQQELYSGHPLAASLLLDDIVSLPRAVSHLGSGVQLMHAGAMSLSGREVGSLSVPDGQPIQIAGQTTQWPAPGEWSTWVKKHFQRIDAFEPQAAPDYPLFGATPNRNGNSDGQMPLMNLRWMLDTTASPRQERSVRQAEEELATGGRLPPPSWVPLRVGNQLLMRTTERLVGVDYRTGKRVWAYPWQSVSEFFEDDEETFDPIIGEETGPNNLLAQRVWNDVPYGQISSDGERVYMLDDLKEVEMIPLSPMMLRGTRPAETRSNTLVALDLESEGKLRWQLGAGAEEATTLADAFFLGPPLPLDGRLYVMVELAGDISLCCLDPESGEELWRQHLVAVESGGIESDPVRRIAGAMPTYHEGVLICPTGAGAIVAIDLGDRMMRWGVNYPRNMELARSISSSRNRSLELGQLMQRWHSGTAIADGNTVLVTPVESDRLYGFDVITGERRFPEKPRSYMRYLAGIRDGRAVVVGANKIQAFDVASGASLWETPRDLVSAGQQISGIGMFGKDAYFVPTTSNQIIQVSLDDGSVLARRTTRYPLGNLVAVDGEVIAHGPTQLAVAFGESTLEPLVNRMLSENPNDFDAMVRKSELLIQKGQRREALDMLARARQTQPDNDEVRMLSVTAMLGMLRADEEVDDAFIETLDQLIDRPSQRAELLSLRIRSAIRDQQWQLAIDRLLDLSQLVVSEPLLEASSDQIINDPARHCSLDAWISARVAEIAAAADAPTLAAIDAHAGEILGQRTQLSTNVLKRIVRHFDFLDGSDVVRMELAARLIKENRNLELERMLLSTRIPNPQGFEAMQSEHLIWLAEAYVRGDMDRDAAAVLDVLRDRDDIQPRTRIDDLAKRIHIPTVQWSDQVTMQWDSRRGRIPNLTIRQRVAETHVLAGKTFDGWRLVSEATSPLSLRDRTGMPRRIPMELMPVKDIDREAQTCGGTMVVVMPSGLIGLDLFHVLLGDGEAIMWRRGLSGDSGPLAKRRSKSIPFGDQKYVYNIDSSDVANPPEFKLGPVLGDRVLVLQGGDLMAIDLTNAETLWRNSDAPKSGVVVSNGRQAAVISNAMQPEIAFFDLLDGRKLAVRPWSYGLTWAAAGAHVLSYKPIDSDRYDVQLIDPFDDRIIASTQTEGVNNQHPGDGVARGFGRVINGRYLTMLHTNGQALVWDLVEGREISRPELTPYDDLQGLNILPLDGQLLFLPRRKIVRNRDPQAPQLQASDTTLHQPAHAVHAISLDDGSVRWSREFERPWGCTLVQPVETPIVVFSRSMAVYSATSRYKTVDIMALDVDDGKELHKVTEKEVLVGSNELRTRLTVQPGLSRVIAQMGGELLTFKFGPDQNDPSSAEQSETPQP